MRFRWINQEDQAIRRFQARADRIASQILDERIPWEDIVLRIESLRREAENLFPDRTELFDWIYVRRFERLRRQFRRGGEGPPFSTDR